MFLWRERPSIICTCSEYPFIYELISRHCKGTEAQITPFSCAPVREEQTVPMLLTHPTNERMLGTRIARSALRRCKRIPRACGAVSPDLHGAKASAR